MNVLIADDSPVVRGSLVVMLSELAEVDVIRAVHDAQEAIAAAEHLRPDAAILDIRMPKGGGLRALREIKRLRTSTFIIMLTCFPYEAYRVRCMQAGADCFLRKGADLKRIPELIRRQHESYGEREHEPRACSLQLGDC